MDIIFESPTIESLEKIMTSSQVGRAIAYARSSTANGTAFRVLEYQRKEINKMTQRTRTLTRAMTGVVKAKKINRDKSVAHVVTKGKKRFSGWVEQPSGGLDNRKRKWTDEARTSRSHSKKVKQKLRFKPGRKIEKFDNNTINGDADDLLKLSWWTKAKHKRGETNEPFLVNGLEKIPDGVYFLNRSGKLKFAAFTHSTRNVKKRKIQYEAIKTAINRKDVQREWSKAIDFQLNRAISLAIKK